MRLTRRTIVPVPSPSAFAGFRFPPDVIVLAVRWYLRFGLSYRDVEELLAEHGIDVDHVTVHRWVQRFAPLLADAARFGRHRIGDRWHVDETYVKVAGRWARLVYEHQDRGTSPETGCTAGRVRVRETAIRSSEAVRAQTCPWPVERRPGWRGGLQTEGEVASRVRAGGSAIRNRETPRTRAGPWPIEQRA